MRFNNLFFSRVPLLTAAAIIIIFSFGYSSIDNGDENDNMVVEGLLTDSSAKEDAVNANSGDNSYNNQKLGISFKYPAEWLFEEESFPEHDYPDVITHKIRIYGANGEKVLLYAFNKPESLEVWLKEHSLSEEADLGSMKSTVCGSSAYSSVIVDDDGETSGITLTFEGKKTLFTLTILLNSRSDIRAIDNLIQSISTSAADKTGKTKLSFDLYSVKFTNNIEVSYCCEYEYWNSPQNRYYYNPYPCCSPPGNCTWYCEKRRVGDNNFIFDGMCGKNAITWMYHGWAYGYANLVGGTIPQVNAVAVFNFAPDGHVAHITRVNADGSIAVDEQNCGTTCPTTIGKTYSTSTLRSSLLGYIYSGNRPEPSAKAILETYYGATTYVDDYNFSSVYNFQSYGPGHQFGSSICNGHTSYHRGWFHKGNDGHGYNRFYHYTKSKAGSSENYGKWAFSISTPGVYELHAFIPGNYATATRARYKVRWYYCFGSTCYWGTSFSNPVNQNAVYNNWAKIVNPGRADGNWYFNTTSSSYIQLNDNYEGQNPEAGLWLGFDAIRFVKR